TSVPSTRRTRTPAARLAASSTQIARGSVLRAALVQRNVEVQDLFPHSHAGVERDGGIVAVVGLHEDHPGAPFTGDGLERVDQGGGDALTTAILIDSKIVDIDFA